MSQLKVELIVKLVIELDDDSNLDEVLENMDYDFNSDNAGIKSEIVQWEQK